MDEKEFGFIVKKGEDYRTEFKENVGGIDKDLAHRPCSSPSSFPFCAFLPVSTLASGSPVLVVLPA